MTRAEIVEKIKEKSILLERYRSEGLSSDDPRVRTVQNDLRELQSALSASKPKRPNKPVYISGG